MLYKKCEYFERSWMKKKTKTRRIESKITDTMLTMICVNSGL